MNVHAVKGDARPRAAGAPTVDAPAAPEATVLHRGGAGTTHAWVAQAQYWLRLVSPFLLLGLWEVLSRGGVLDDRFFPPPSEIAQTGLDGVRDGTLVSATADSLRRLVLGFGIGASLGIVVGLWLGLSRWFRALFEPWIQITYPVPKLAMYPLLVLLVGLGDVPILCLLAIAVFYVVAINTMAGVLSIRPVILDVGRDCEASFSQFFLTIALPATMPHIFTSLEISLGLAYVVLIAAEFIGAKTGLGAIIWSSWQLFDVAPMYVAITTVSICGYISVIAMRRCGDLLMPWRNSRR